MWTYMTPKKKNLTAPQTNVSQMVQMQCIYFEMYTYRRQGTLGQIITVTFGRCPCTVTYLDNSFVRPQAPLYPFSHILSLECS